jgi:type IV secretion system protein TrbJ
MNAKRLIISVIAILVVGRVAATGLIAGATEITQILNNIQLVMHYIEQVQQTVTQIKQYETMLKNLKTITPSELLDERARQLWHAAGMQDTFKAMRQVVVNGQRVAYNMGSIDAAFRKAHPGYGNYAGTGINFNKAYADWSEGTLTAVKNSAGMVGFQSEQLESEEGMLNQLRSKSSSASGQLQALQAGNEIGAAMVSQLQQLRALQLAQAHAQNAAIAGEQSRQDADKDALLNFMKRPNAKVPTREEIRAANRK